jgi:hypothetical protein
MILEQFMSDKQDIFGQKTVNIDENKLKDTDATRFHLAVPPNLMKDFKAFVQRYNAFNTPKTSMNECGVKAISQFLDRMPLMYTDPKAYAEELKLREQLKKQSKQ